MLHAFVSFINEKQLFAPTDRLLLAVSGGIDSVVLAELCRQAGFTFGIAHCNFQLRGIDSEGDEIFVQELAQNYRVECHVQRFETKVFAKNKGISTQMAARELRYRWFEDLRRTHRYDYILTAHHQDDLLETILINITRGTGLAGLHGILPKNGHLVRPLVFATRTEIKAFLTQHQLAWREDSSNASTDYMRNRLRHDVIPILRELNPKVSAAAAQLAERVKAVENILKHQNNLLRTDIVQTDGPNQWIDIEYLAQQIEPVEFLAAQLNDFGFTYEQAKRIWTRRNGQTGQHFFSPTHTLILDRGRWLVHLTQEPDSTVYELDENDTEIGYAQGILSWVKTEVDMMESNQATAYFDADELRFPLRLRRWQPGDWFCPLGMKGKRKKISDFLVDAKVPSTLKNQIYVLESEGKIAWLMGFRTDDRFKINEKTTKAIKFTLI
jgi:tRNA(Ile)-lysidine synthase